MSKTTLKITTLCLIAFAFAQAAMAGDCPEVVEKESNVAATQLKLGNGVCYIKLSDQIFAGETPNVKKVYPSRVVSWNSEGHLMTLIDSGDKASGARGYHIVPVDNAMVLSGTMHQGSEYKVKASGLEWSMDKSSAELHLPANCKGEVLPPAMDNQGGLNISSCAEKLVIDSGWKMGASPELNRGGQSTVHDPSGATCKVNNSAIFKYAAGEEASPRFKSSQEWYRFLKSQPSCKNLKINFLQGSVSYPSGSAAPSSNSGGTR